MPSVTSVRAYANNEVIYVAWAVDAAIPGCLGFDVRRVDAVTGDETSLPAWVPFQGQTNKNWQAGTTAKWPVQRFSWKDLTWRDELDAQTGAKPSNPQSIEKLVKYHIVPLLGTAAKPVPREDLGAMSDVVHLTQNFGDISVSFNNGILSTQWLTNALKKRGGKPLVALKAAIAKPNDPIRTKLAGDSITFLRALVDRAQSDGGTVVLALYELSDPELCALLLKNAKKIRIILSNTSASDKAKKIWDTENAPIRKKLHAAGADIQNRMFNNDHIGHNKFAIYLDPTGRPTTVLAGSTNWTQNGLCAQSNNALLIESPDLAKTYYDYWKRLYADKLPDPKPLSAPTRNVQGDPLRRADMTPNDVALDGGKTQVTAWFSPNTAAKEKTPTSPAPPDMAQLFSLMRQAKDTILFLVFLPSMHGDKSIISEAIQLGTEDPHLLVLGAVSSSMAMPVKAGAKGGAVGSTFIVNSKRKARKPTGKAVAANKKAPEAKASPVFAQNATEVVQAAALTAADVVGAFEAEQLSAGNAIIHDKIVVVDPLSPNALVACSSHNLGYKASYGNDENLLIIRNNPKLAQAYAVHVLDIYDHYRFRAEQAAAAATGGKEFSGFLQPDDSWQQDYIDGKRGTDAPYFSKPG